MIRCWEKDRTVDEDDCPDCKHFESCNQEEEDNSGDGRLKNYPYQNVEGKKI